MVDYVFARRNLAKQCGSFGAVTRFNNVYDSRFVSHFRKRLENFFVGCLLTSAVIFAEVSRFSRRIKYFDRPGLLFDWLNCLLLLLDNQYDVIDSCFQFCMEIIQIFFSPPRFSNLTMNCNWIMYASGLATTFSFQSSPNISTYRSLPKKSPPDSPFFRLNTTIFFGSI